jgi:hypothetical protein
MAFGALDALRDGYHLSPVVDGWVSLARELQRESARIETAAATIEIVLTDRLLKEQ